MCEHYCPECGKKFSVEPSQPVAPAPIIPYGFVPYFPIPVVPPFLPPVYIGDIIQPQVIITCDSANKE
jgi:hypothetical protein